jgi:GWxTD domain-containing protein
MKSAGITLLCLAVYAVAQPLAAPYGNWLNEDVAYIVTDTERAAFVSLQTDTERDQFIQQFWLRHDPTPDTIENEFREEHYRRIAYANEYFGSNIPGWKTDRGRIYITYGPPDEIDTHESSQVWRYRVIDGVGTNVTIEFVDSTGSGEFHMTMEPADKSPLLYVPDGGVTMMEQMGMSDKTLRFTGDGPHPAAPIVGQPERLP